MKSRKESKRQTFRHKYTIIFGLTSVLPLLLFLFVMEQYNIIQEPKAALTLGISLVIALLGFVFSLRIVKQVNTLVRDFIKVERGELRDLGERATSGEISEMVSIADSFNKTLTDLKSHTEELENLFGKFNTLSELAELVARILNINESLQTILHRTMAALNARVGSVMLLDEGTQTLKIACAEGLDESIVTKTILRLGERIAGKVAQTGEAVVVEDIEQEPHLQKANDPKYEGSSFISMPLKARGKVMGVLNLSKRGDRRVFTQSDLTFLKSLLGHVSFALENARLMNEAKEAATRLKQVVNDQRFQLDKVKERVAKSTKLLQQAQKMEAIGTLAGGIAHDFNNLLTIILGNISMARDDLKPEDEISAFLNQAEEASLRAKELSHQLITFSRGGTPVRKRASIVELLRESTDLALVGSNVSCDFFIAADLWPVEHDERQMKHVINNLMTNAVEAMPAGGRIALAAENLIVTGKKEDSGVSLPEGKYVKISVRDKGLGIPEEHLAMIFDPYFSTKERGNQKGMGLGLATAYSIINKHDGNVSVESKAGAGTTFHVYLPASDKAVVPKKDVGERPAAEKAKILVMEDEEMLRDLTGKMVGRLGYEVELVNDGDEAIKSYRKAMDAGRPFDAVILDLTVRGGMGGKEAVRKLQEMDSEVKAIVSSGYSDDPVMTNWRQYGFVGVMSKPYQKEDLRRVLQRLSARQKA